MSTKYKTLNFYITKKDIENGKKKNPSFCPVSLSIRRIFGLKTLVCGGSITIYLDYDTTINKPTPSFLAHFIDEFDIGYPSVPIKFSLQFTEHEYEMVSKAKRKAEESKAVKRHPVSIETEGNQG